MCNLTNCLACNKNGGCLISNSRNFMSRGQIVGVSCGIPNCASCNQGSIYCNQCSQGYTLDSTNNCVPS